MFLTEFDYDFQVWSCSSRFAIFYDQHDVFLRRYDNRLSEFREPLRKGLKVLLTVNDANFRSNEARVNVNVNPVDDSAPILDLDSTDLASATGFATVYMEEGAAVSVVSPNIAITDADLVTMATVGARRATLTVRGTVTGGDVLRLSPTVTVPFTAAYNPANLTMMINGIGSYGELITTLRVRSRDRRCVLSCVYVPCIQLVTHTRIHARTCINACARTHIDTHTHTHTRACRRCNT